MLSRHAKRTTVSMEDVKLCCRRNPSLLEHIQNQADKIKADKGGVAASEEGSSDGKDKGGRTKGGRKKKTIIIEDD